MVSLLKIKQGGDMKERIRAKALLGLPLTQRERAMFLLLIATDSELRYFLKKEKANEKEL